MELHNYYYTIIDYKNIDQIHIFIHKMQLCKFCLTKHKYNIIHIYPLNKLIILDHVEDFFQLKAQRVKPRIHKHLILGECFLWKRIRDQDKQMLL